jgi:Fe-S cluster assembly protein SufD
VKCSHGATIGRLDDDALFFLRARGIGRDEARRLLIHAFASEVIQRINVESLRSRLEQVVRARFHETNVREGSL